jgi:hypothetical protein
VRSASGTVFLGLKAGSLLRSHQTGGHRLDPSADRPRGFFPQQRRELVATMRSRMRRACWGHQVLVDGRGAAMDSLTTFLVDLIESEPVCAVVGQLQKLLRCQKWPLPPVRAVARKTFRYAERLFQVGDDLFLPLMGCSPDEAVSTSTPICFWQVPAVARWTPRPLIRPWVFADGLGLGGDSTMTSSISPQFTHGFYCNTVAFRRMQSGIFTRASA